MNADRSPCSPRRTARRPRSGGPGRQDQFRAACALSRHRDPQLRDLLQRLTATGAPAAVTSVRRHCERAVRAAASASSLSTVSHLLASQQDDGSIAVLLAPTAHGHLAPQAPTELVRELLTWGYIAAITGPGSVRVHGLAAPVSSDIPQVSAGSAVGGEATPRSLSEVLDDARRSGTLRSLAHYPQAETEPQDDDEGMP